MNEINFSKKQLTPLIQKYGIDVDKNTLFHEIINMFNDQPSYHVWAVKAVFSGALNIKDLRSIKEWAIANPNQIKLLDKKNIVSYTTADDFRTLFNEINGIMKKTTVNNVIDLFNTDQRKLLKDATGVANISNVNAATSSSFDVWFKRLNSFGHLCRKKKDKVVRTLSAVRNINELKKLIEDALKETYMWDKDDMLTFVENNTPNVSVVYNMGPIVILEIPSYEDSNKICYGRAQWCITRSADYFRQYVTDKKGNRQFFYFDFSKKETHELAHVGFTVNPTRGITNAHSTSNGAMVGSSTVTADNDSWNISKLLKARNIPYGTFLNLKKLKGYEWELNSIVSFVASTNGCEMVCQNGNIVVAKVNGRDAISKLAGFSFINVDNFAPSNSSKVFVLFNLNVPVDANNSVICMEYRKDEYETYSMTVAYNTYGENCLKDNPLKGLGVSSTDFMDFGSVNPNILLHKYIDEGAEEAAMKLIEENPDIDINYAFRGRIPVYSAIDNHLFELFSVIIAHKKFKANVNCGFDENFVQILLWNCYLDDLKLTDEQDKKVRKIVLDLIEKGVVDINETDINDDTLLHIAANDAKMLWLVENLVARKDVNVNIKNDMNLTAFDTALFYGNFEAAKLIGMREGLVTDSYTEEIAKSKHIKLADYINPTKLEGLGSNSQVAAASNGMSSLYKQIFK